MTALTTLQDACAEIADTKGTKLPQNFHEMTASLAHLIDALGGGGANKPKAADLDSMSDGQILELDAEVLSDIQAELVKQAKDLKRRTALFNRMLRTKYDAKITKAYKDKGEDTGSATLKDGETVANLSRSKTVEWDQEGLMAYLDTLPVQNARHLAKFAVAVSETNYKGAMPDVKAELDKHRKIKVGATKVEFETVEN